MPVNFPRQAAPRPWTTGELRRLREVCATGLTIDQIHARGLFPGRTRSAIGNAVEKNQCSPRRRPKAAHGYVIVSATMPPTLRAWLDSEARRLRSTRAEALRRILSAVRAGAVKVESDPMYKPSRRTGMEPDAGGSAIACVAPRWFPVRRLTCSTVHDTSGYAIRIRLPRIVIRACRSSASRCSRITSFTSMMRCLTGRSGSRITPAWWAVRRARACRSRCPA